MKSLEDSQKKIQQLCELLKKDAVDPAKKEAGAIIDEAKSKARNYSPRRKASQASP